MTTCPSCAKELPPGDFPFCPFCTAPLDTAPVPREQRKTVTVLFCDVTGSTELGESVDPEALRSLLARYFSRMKGIVERHGGAVEKFIGDAVMAVFGIPQVHEDDALRACRAAIEMGAALPDLGLQGRIGLNTGEVVTGTAERLATGDAVNVAARLEQAAATGEILIGAETLALVRDAVDTEPVEPLELKGKARRVEAYRLLAVTGGQERRHVAPMVGRARELDRLRDTFEQARESRSCQLFTVLGAAGVGKSRLAAEFLSDADATIARGRCVSYGDGITYWPVVEVVKQLGAGSADAAVAATLKALVGESEQTTSADEIAWAFRKLLEEQAHEQPVVCVFDDIHWGEETFFALVEHVADFSRAAPILLLCMARPELLDRRPEWGGGKLNATTILLEPLSDDDADRLLDALGGADEQLRERIRATAEGNPLFVEEMLTLVREAGDVDVDIPPTIRALLAARLDQLNPPEREALECGSVEGHTFHASAVQALRDGEPQQERLLSLVRKELLRPDKALVPGDEAFRFRHLLIRDAAYDALPKASRARLHERLAAWLERHWDELAERDELLGYHLEQAAVYKAELGQPDRTLAARAGERLAAAGRRAVARGDEPAGVRLLERALTLLRPLRLDVPLELDVARAQRTPLESANIAEKAAERADELGDRPGNALASALAAYYRTRYEPDPRIDELEALTREALRLLEETGDHAGLMHAWLALAIGVAVPRGQFGQSAEAAEQALRHARIAGQDPGDLLQVHWALCFGPRPADEALRTLEELAAATTHPLPALGRGWLLAMLGRFDEAWPVARDAAERMEGTTEPHVRWLVLGEIARLDGDAEGAADHLQRYCESLEEREERGYLSTFGPWLGRDLCRLGRPDEGELWAKIGRDLGAEEDLSAQALWRQAQALVEAARGRLAEAESLAREAVAFIERTDLLTQQGDALRDLADVLELDGRRDEAAAALEQALDRYERKKNLAMVAQVRPKLESLRDSVPR